MGEWNQHLAHGGLAAPGGDLGDLFYFQRPSRQGAHDQWFDRRVLSILSWCGRNPGTVGADQANVFESNRYERGSGDRRRSIPMERGCVSESPSSAAGTDDTLDA